MQPAKNKGGRPTMYGPHNKPKRISVYVPEQIHRTIKLVAAGEGVSMSAIARRALAAGVAELESSTGK